MSQDLTLAQAYQHALELHRDGRLSEAESLCRQLLAHQPDHVGASYLLGRALLLLGQTDEAVTAFGHAAALRPNVPEAHYSLGVALGQQGAIGESIAAYRRALALRPGYPEARYSLGSMLLLQGDYAEGWAAYEARLEVSGDGGRPVARRFDLPRWDGRHLGGCRILLHAEQGAGDTIQFIRYAPLVTARGGRVTLLCQPPLGRLLTGQHGIEQVVTDPSDVRYQDFESPLMSLPWVFDTTLAGVPRHMKYLSADPALAEVWRRRMEEIADCRLPIAELKAMSDAPLLDHRLSATCNPQSVSTPPLHHPITPPLLKVGLAWSGNVANPVNPIRSLPLSALALLGQVPGVQFYSLQKGAPAEQAKSPPPGMRLIDWAGELADFADTAALIANLDLVISTDTSVPHLSGALGKPTWVMLSAVPDFRWMLDRRDSPWYPTATLFRQPRPRDWEPVVRQVAEALAERVRLRLGQQDFKRP